MTRRNESQKAHFEYSFEQVRCLTSIIIKNSSARGTSMSTNQHTGTFDPGDESSSTNDQGLRSSRTYDANYSVVGARPGLPSTSAKRLAKGLGWFSVGLVD